MESKPLQAFCDPLSKDEFYRRFSKAARWRRRVRRSVYGFAWLLLVRIPAGAKRILDFSLALVLLLLLAPLLIRIVIVWRATGSTVFDRTPRVGRWGEEFQKLSFARRSNRLSRFAEKTRLLFLPVLFNVLKGDMSFIGPRPAAPGELSATERLVRKRFDVRPGLIGLWWLRQRTNIAYTAEIVADAEYVDTHTVWRDLGLALRAVPAVLYGGGAVNARDSVRLLGIPIHNLTMSEAIAKIVAALDGGTPSQVCFVNADCANVAWRNPAYRRVLQSAALSLADGIGLKLAGKLLGREIKQNVNGTDMFPRLCEALAASGHGIYLLGARPGVPEAVRGWIARHYPGVNVAGLRHGYYPAEEEPRVVADIAASGARLLLVALGAPRQDVWIHRHLRETGARVALGVGGLFDFYSGAIPRAPQWLREMGFEWMYRLYQEPGRMWRRYLLGNALFLFRVVKQRLRPDAFRDSPTPTEA